MVTRYRTSILKGGGLVLALLTPSPILLGQTVPGQSEALVDRIAAVVGDSVVTLTQIQERVFQLSSQGVEVPTDPAGRARLQREILDQMVGELLILQAAAQDTTIVLDDTDIDEMVGEDLQSRARQFPGGQTAFQEALQESGFTLASYREFLRGQIRQQRLYQQYMAKRSRDLSGIMVDDAEVEAFFREQQGNLGERPPTVAFTQIIIPSEPSDSARADARSEAERIRQMALEGEEFEDLAKRFSQEPGAQESGGDLGWFRRGDMMESFEEAAFALQVNRISEPVETDYGFHIIKVERRRSGEVRARHILIRPVVTEGDVAAAREEANEARTRLEAGEDLAVLRQEMGDLASPDSLEVPFDRLTELPPGFAEPLLQGEAGQIIGPIEYEAVGETRFALVKVEEVRDGGEYSLEELRPQIVERLQQEKLVDRILEELRAKTYIQIRI